MKSRLTRIAAGTFLLFMFISTGIFLFTKYLHDNQRDKYERFILKTISDAGIQVKSGEPKAADQPEMAALQDYLITLDPVEKRVPLERLKLAYEQMRLMNADWRLKSAVEPLQWEIISSNMGGRTRCITFDPNSVTGNKVWAGAVTGGLWYNNNITSSLSSWVPVDDFWPTLSISAIVFDPNDPQIMYVGTGEAYTATTIYRESTGVGMGIFKSTDGGQTWNLLSSTSNFKYVTDIEIRTEAGNSVIYAGVVSEVYQGVNHVSLPSDGLYRSINGGQSWAQVLPNITGSDKPYPVADIEITAYDRILIGSMRNLDGNGGGTILYSDQGIIGTWTIYDDYVGIIENDPEYYVPGRVMIGSAPSDGNIAYALFDAGKVNSNNGFIYSEGRYIARTDDGGVSWNYRPVPSGGYYYWATIGWHALTTAVDPNNPDELYIGGLDVYKSEDGGFTWYQVSDWTGMYWGGGSTYVHADIHDIDYKLGSSQELVITSDGGVFYTSNASSSGPSFQEMNSAYGSLQFYSCAIYPVAGSVKYVGGLQDNGTLYHTGTPLTIFDMIDGGDGAYCFIDQNQPQYMITSVYYNQYSLFNNGQYDTSMSDWSSGIFINPADYDYKLNTLYANACSFGGNQANYILRIKGIPDNISGTYQYLATGMNVWFSHVKYSPYSPQGSANLYVGSLSGRLFKVTNAQATPEKTEITGSDFPEANISCVAIGGSEDTILVTFSNYGVLSVWQSYDGGVSWEEKEGNLPDIPIRWAIYHPENSKYAMLATELGIWTTENLSEANVTWTPDNEGLANVRIDMLQMRLSDNTVLAATHGRGLATATWDIVTGVNRPLSINEFSIYPNPSDGHFRIKMKSDFEGKVQIEVFSSSGQLVFSKEFSCNAVADEMGIDLSGLADGNYFINFLDGGKASSKKITIKK